MNNRDAFLRICLSPPGKGGWPLQKVREEARLRGLPITGTKKELCNLIADKLYPTIPPPPPEIILSNIPPAPVEECSFCCRVNNIRSKQKDISPITIYCRLPKSCNNCDSGKQYNIIGNTDQNNYAKEIFKSIVLDIETKDIYGSMIDRAKFYYQAKFITAEQRDQIIISINNYRLLYENFVDNVLNYNRYKEINGNEYINLTGSTNWADAIIILRNYFVSRFNEEFMNILSQFTKPEQTEYLQKYCENKSYNDCTLPCTPNKGIFKNTCTY